MFLRGIARRLCGDDCPKSGWHYDSRGKDKAARKLQKRCEKLLREMRSGRIALLETAIDTKPIHRRMFRGMTPLCHRYYAGNQRGNGDYPCIKDLNVGPGGQPGVYALADKVEGDLANLAVELTDFVQAIETQGHNFQPAQLLAHIVEGVCYALAEFLRIHPYADGNGHMGRYVVWALFLRLGCYPQSWPLEERPEDPYIACLTQFRAGNRDPLRQFMLRHLVFGLAPKQRV